MVFIWAATFMVSGASSGHQLAHFICLILFTLCRFSHTICYANALAKPRSWSYNVGLITAYALLINGIVAAARNL